MILLMLVLDVYSECIVKSPIRKAMLTEIDCDMGFLGNPGSWIQMAAWSMHLASVWFPINTIPLLIRF